MPSRVDGPLRRGQQLAESLMTLTLFPHIPAGMTKDADGYDVPNFDDQPPHPGKAQGPSATASDTVTEYVEIGGVALPVLKSGLHIPISAPVPKPGRVRGRGWEYTVAKAGFPADPALAGKRYLVVAVPVKSFATARRLDVVELPSEED